MNRHHGKLIALLALFAAVVVVAASGAFTSVEAQRTAQVDVAGDASAFLALTPNATSLHGSYASDTAGANDNQLSINVTGAAAMGDGVNENAVTTADHVFDVQNQGTQDVVVYFSSGNSVPDSVIDFYHNGTTASPGTSGSLEGASNTVVLNPGDKVSVGVKVDTRGYSGGSFTETVTVHAEAQ